MSPDWFRRTTWTPADEAAFRERLRRSRGDNKAQYLRIQAHTLHEAGKADLLPAALTLLDELVQDYPDPIQLPQAHGQRGRCLIDLGRPVEALDAFRAAMQAERRGRTVKTEAYLDFGDLVIGLGRSELLPEVTQVLDEFGGDEAFPISVYRYSALRALASEARGNRQAARQFACAALTAAAAKASPFRYHRKLGLATLADPELYAKLEELCAV